MAMNPATRSISRSARPAENPLAAVSDPSPEIHFDFSFAPTFRLAALPFGIVPSRTGVTIDDERFTARFGPWTVSTPLANVLSAEVTGPYQVLKVIGGPHVSLRDRGLTFATTSTHGVCIRFVRPVTGLEPTGRISHPSLTVTVDEPAALADLLEHAAARHGAAGPEDEAIPVAEIVQETNDDLSGLTAAELRGRAKELGLSGVAKLRKAELVELLRAPDPAAW